MQDKLKQIGDTSNIIKIQSISGGDINNAYYVRTEAREYFIKTNKQVPATFFQAEAEGLEQIRKTKTIRVPDVYHYEIASSNEEICLMMEWIEPGKSKTSGQLLGEQLARLHLAEAGSQYGMHGTTFVGEITQENALYDNWLIYYREKRLRAQLEIGINRGTIPINRRKLLEQLLDKLDRFIPEHPGVSLLHGDLWGGNWLTGPQGKPYLIDPSVVYGDNAFEIAFTEVFGGFPDTFYESYQYYYPLPDYYEEIKPLYQLFYLLVHLNLFGEGYGPSVDRILSRYN
ncbi:Fructosamine-3-kinase [Gracilibacillus ureilyticus]|uniref:Fructosamine-3-kinase n=1 Tax=Gracilibacillus ureilyticus TaxID=531814 RepID=A0A1H9SVR1_9BACI|nr:fructosamine kinase family protein [Gracilibacillus ureilyticus]SER89006.1 Fructosamine-3-kinase [Gracilibacillus ureilyticus]